MLSSIAIILVTIIRESRTLFKTALLTIFFEVTYIYKNRENIPKDMLQK